MVENKNTKVDWGQILRNIQCHPKQVRINSIDIRREVGEGFKCN